MISVTSLSSTSSCSTSSLRRELNMVRSSSALSFMVMGLSRASLETTLPIRSHISSSLSSLDKSISESIISLILCPKSSSTRNTPSHVSYDISKLIPLPQLYKLLTRRYRHRNDRRLNQLNPLNYIA